MKARTPTLPLLTALLLFASLPPGLRAGDQRLEEALAPLLEKSAAAAAREIHFEESRHFTFRREPVRLAGIIRLQDGLGVSIHYPGENKAVIIDESGVLLRAFSPDGIHDDHARGVDAELPRLLQSLFRLDLPSLREYWHLSLAGGEGGFMLTLTPKPSVTARIRTVEMRFHEDRVHSITLALQGNRRVVIEPKTETTLESFDAEALRLYFRAR